jgi:hypothetical protein
MYDYDESGFGYVDFNIDDILQDQLDARLDAEYALKNGGVPRWSELVQHPERMTLGEMQNEYIDYECGCGSPMSENEWFESENKDGEYNHLKKHYI